VKKRENTLLGAISSYVYASSVRPSSVRKRRSRVVVYRPTKPTHPPTPARETRKHENHRRFLSSYLARTHTHIYIDTLNVWLYTRIISCCFTHTVKVSDTHPCVFGRTRVRGPSVGRGRHTRSFVRSLARTVVGFDLSDLSFPFVPVVDVDDDDGDDDNHRGGGLLLV
jgi:hypothetical protein